MLISEPRRFSAITLATTAAWIAKKQGTKRLRVPVLSLSLFFMAKACPRGAAAHASRKIGIHYMCRVVRLAAQLSARKLDRFWASCDGHGFRYLCGQLPTQLCKKCWDSYPSFSPRKGFGTVEGGTELDMARLYHDQRCSNARLETQPDTFITQYMSVVRPDGRVVSFTTFVEERFIVGSNSLLR